MTIEEAIKKAIEGGWKVDHWSESGDWYFPNHLNLKLNTERVLLSPNFWQSLGKAMGWQLNYEWKEKGISKPGDWLKEWHKFIDHLAEGKTPQEYFKSLL